ncbi:PAS domain S-box protein [bacterium]|nr:PAS domain S-box protein [bacterium]
MDLLHPDDREKAVQRIAEHYTEYSVIRKDGSDIPVLFKAMPILTDRKITGFRAVITDVRRLKQAEQELRNKDFIISSASSVIATCTLDSAMTYVNSTFLETWGFDNPDQVIGRLFTEFWLVDDKIDEIMAVLKGEERKWSGEIQAKKKDGSLFDVFVSAATVLDDRGNSVGLMSTSTDITERKRSEEALKESEARFRNLMENIDTVAVQSYVKDGTTQYWNKASERLYGYNKQEAIGCNLLDLIIPPEMKDDVTKAIRDMVESSQPIPSEELLLMHKDGSRIPVISNHVIVSVPGREQELFCLDVDITELKQAEEQLKASLKEKETLLQEIHHRVKNNMNVVSSLLSLHKNSTKNEEVKKALQESQGRVYAMSAVHESLYNSKNLAEIDLMDYLNKLSSSLLQTYSVNPGKVQFKIDGDDVRVDIDKASPLGLTINELISNALKYAFPDDRRGKIEVTLQKQENRLKLTIQDNGVGMPEGFDWKNSNTLGLKLVRTLVENQLDGSIDMESNNGTKFTIKFNIEN